MKPTSFTQLLMTATASAIALIFAPGQRVNAATLKAIQPGTTINTFAECLNDGIALIGGKNTLDLNGWQWSIDNPNDGVDGFLVGGNSNRYEMYTMAIKETANSIFVALNGNMPLTGIDGTGAVDGNIGWGDLFFNLSGLNFSTASQLGSLFAVRFAGTNDSFAPSIGLYGNVTATSVTGINSGFSSLQAYNQRVSGYCTGPNCGPSLGDLAANTPYFNQTQSLNAIASGNFLAPITYLTSADLLAAGYNFNQPHAKGSQTIAFKFDKAGICDSGVCAEITVPEPSSLAGLAVLGLIVAGRKLRQRKVTA